jgi:superfamily II DNA helicase RecQ
VISVEKHFCPNPGDPGWAVCIEHVEAGSGEPSARDGSGKAVDYREVLDPATFTLYAGLRSLRKEIALLEGVPIYAVMTNEQLAAIAQQRCKGLEDLKAVPGLGEARVRKYGPRFLNALRQALAEAGAEAAATASAPAAAPTPRKAPPDG